MTESSYRVAAAWSARVWPRRRMAMSCGTWYIDNDLSCGRYGITATGARYTVCVTIRDRLPVEKLQNNRISCSMPILHGIMLLCSF